MVFDSVCKMLELCIGFGVCSGASCSTWTTKSHWHCWIKYWVRKLAKQTFRDTYTLKAIAHTHWQRRLMLTHSSMWDLYYTKILHIHNPDTHTNRVIHKQNRAHIHTEHWYGLYDFAKELNMNWCVMTYERENSKNLPDKTTISLTALKHVNWFGFFFRYFWFYFLSSTK